MRRPRYFAPVVLGVSVLLTAGCALDETLPPPHCVRGDSAWIVAQSVPGASQVPCLSDLPDGWSIDRVIINQDHTVVEVDSDRAGGAAAILYYEPSCDVGDAVAVTSEFPDTERLELLHQIEPSFRGQRFYRFAGGCVRWEFEFDSGVSSTLSIEIGDALSLVARDELNVIVRDLFIDQEL